MKRSRLEDKSSIEPPAEAATDLAHVYTLIHSFLRDRSHTKAASALKKSVTGIISIDDDAEYKGPTLQKILEEWRELKAAADAIDTSSSDSSSDQDSSDDDSQIEDNLAGKNTSKSGPSDSSDDSSDDGGDSPQAVPQVAKLLESQRDSSKTLSSADDVESDEESTDETDSDSSDEPNVDTDSNSVPTSKKSGSKGKVARAKKPATSSSDVSSSSSPDSDSGEEDELPSKTKPTSGSDSSSSSDSDDMPSALKGKPKKCKTKSTSSSDSSSGSDSDSDQDSKPATTNKLKRKAASSSDSDSSSEDDASEGSSSSSSSESSSSQSGDELEETPALSAKPDPEARAMKKRRPNEEGKTIVVTTTVTALGNARGVKAPRKLNAPFQRVKVDTVKFDDEKLKDNSFESRGARQDDYGARANRDLIVTRGDGFRKEKNKKKRGSYRGGDITLQSHSFKFE